MTWDGNGSVRRTDGERTGSTVWVQAKNAGRDIVSRDHDTHDQDLAEAIEQCVNLDGENELRADLPLNENLITNHGGRKYKSADTARSNTTTRTDDPHLAGWSLSANTLYSVRGYIRASGDPGDLVCGLVSDGSLTSGRLMYSWNDNSGDLEYTFAVDSLSTRTISLQSDTSIFISGFVYPSSAQTLDFQWAQFSSNATATTLYQGSWIQIEKL